MINNNYFKLLVLVPEDTAEAIYAAKDPQNYTKRHGDHFFHIYSAIVLQGGLTRAKFLSKKYDKLREAAYSVCKDKIILVSVQNELTPDKP